jgi:hypothetical protein
LLFLIVNIIRDFSSTIVYVYVLIITRNGILHQFKGDCVHAYNNTSTCTVIFELYVSLSCQNLATKNSNQNKGRMLGITAYGSNSLDVIPCTSVQTHTQQNQRDNGILHQFKGDCVHAYNNTSTCTVIFELYVSLSCQNFILQGFLKI